MSLYQLLPDLSDEEYQALKEDIAARGVQVPIEFDEDGNVLDGHHRERACRELGISYPRVVRTFASEEEKLDHVLGLNLRRRQLDQGQKRALVLALRDERGWSVRKIAEATGIPKSTVGRYLSPAVPSGTLTKLQVQEARIERALAEEEDARRIIRELRSVETVAKGPIRWADIEAELEADLVKQGILFTGGDGVSRPVPDGTPTVTVHDGVKERTLLVHPVLAAFPSMTPKEAEGLAKSIARYGLINPIITWGGWLLDGRERIRACEKTNTPLRFLEYDRDDPGGCAAMMNLYPPREIDWEFVKTLPPESQARVRRALEE